MLRVWANTVVWTKSNDEILARALRYASERSTCRLRYLLS
jgi:hypothetical protein